MPSPTEKRNATTDPLMSRVTQAAHELNSSRQPGIHYSAKSVGNSVRLVATLTSPNLQHIAEVDLQGGTVMSFKVGKNELFYVSPQSDFTPGKVARGGDQTGLCTFGKRGGAELPPHFVARQTMFKVWNGPRAEAATDATTLTLVVSHHELQSHLPATLRDTFFDDRRLSLVKRVTINDRGELEISLEQSTKGICGDLFLHPYILQTSPVSSLSGLNGLSYEELDLTKGELPFSHEYNKVHSEDTLVLRRPLMRIVELDKSAPTSFTFLDGERKIEMRFEGASHAALWKPSDVQELSDVPPGAERDRFACIEPVYFDRRSDFGTESVTRKLRVKYRFV